MFITTNSCRICLSQKTDSLLSPLFGVPDEQRLHELIKFCSGIDIIKHNYLPEFICHECLSQLIEAEKIKKKCIESDDHLKNMILSINANEEQLISLEEKIHIHIDAITIKPETNTKLPETNEYSPKTTTKFYNCDVCGKTLKYKYKLERHLNYHLRIAAKDKGAPVGGYECNFCNKKLPTKVTLERHMKRLHVPEDDESPIKCNLCSPFLYFESAKSLDFHLKMTHYHVKRYSCEKCNRNFSRKIRYMRHLRHCLNFKIAKENNKLRDNQNLGKLDEHNPASRIFFMCFKCKYAFATRPELMKHITAGCSPDNLKPFY